MAQNIRINFGVNGRVTADQLNKVNNSLKKIGRQGKNVAIANKAIAGTGKAAGFAAKGVGLLKTQLGGLVAAYAGFAVISSSIRKIADFSKAMAEVQTIADVTPKKLGKIRDEILELSAATGKKPADLARAFYQIQSAGITQSAAASDVLRNSTKLAIGGLADLESTINAVTKVLSVYQGEFASSAEITDTLFKSVKLGQVKVEELAIGLPQVISLGKSLGLSFSEVSGAAAAMSKRAGTAALGFTQLRSIFSGVIRGQARAKGLLGENAAAFSLQALRAKGLAGFLRDVNKAAKGNTSTLFKLFGRVEALTGVTAGAADDFKGLEKIIKEVSKTNGDSAKAFDEITKSVGGLLEIIAAKSEVLQLTFGISGEDVLIGVLKRIETSLFTVLANFKIVMRTIKSTLITVGIIIFTRFSIRAVTSLMAIRREFVLLRASAATNLTGVKVGLLSVSAAAKIATISIKVLKVGLTLGLSLILDAVIFKLLEMKEQFGTWKNVFEVFKFQAKITFMQLGLFVDEAILKFWELRQSISSFINDSIVKLGKAVGINVKVDSFDAFKKSIDKSKESIRGTTEEIVALQKQMAKFKLDNAAKDGLADTGKKEKLNFGGGKKAGETEVPGVPSVSGVASRLQSVRDQILLFNEETRLILNERAMLEADEDFAFLQKRLGTEKALKAVANKEALKGTKKAKLAELEFERKIAEEKKKAALAEIRFTELSNKEKLKQTQTTLGLMLQLTQAAGKKFFAITKTVAISESIVAGILGVQKALSGSAPPLNFINAGIVGSLAALNTAKLVSSKPPSFRTGGIVPGTPTGGRDSVLANVEPREAILTQAQQKNFLRLADGEGANNDQLIGAFNRLADVLMNKETNIEIDGRQVALAMRDQRLAGVTI